MSAPVPLLHVANVVARNSIPLLGIAVLGWSPGKLLIVYFADTVASLLALMMLVCDRLFGIARRMAGSSRILPAARKAHIARHRR